MDTNRKQNNMYNFLTGSFIGRQDDILKAYDKYLNKYSSKDEYLSYYAYNQNKWEFWPELFSYDIKGYRVNSELINLRNKYVNKIKNEYLNNKNNWNIYKKLFQ